MSTPATLAVFLGASGGGRSPGRAAGVWMQEGMGGPGIQKRVTCSVWLSLALTSTLLYYLQRRSTAPCSSCEARRLWRQRSQTAAQVAAGWRHNPARH